MSYEGYVEYLCQYGHMTIRDAHEDSPTTCCVNNCGASFVWQCSVDETNCEPRPAGEVHEILIPAESSLCNLGHFHVVRAARYQIPTTFGYRIDVSPAVCLDPPHAR